VRNGHSDSRAVKSPAEFEHEQPVLQEAQRCADEQCIRSSMEQTLRLDKTFGALESRDAGHASDQNAHVHGS